MFKISRRIHSTLDYATDSIVAALPVALNMDDDDPIRKVLHRHATLAAGYTALTNYERGMVKVLPYRVHLGLDAVSILLLIVGAFTSGSAGKRYRWLPLVLAGAEAGVLLLSLPGLKDAEEGE